MERQSPPEDSKGCLSDYRPAMQTLLSQRARSIHFICAMG